MAWRTSSAVLRATAAAVLLAACQTGPQATARPSASDPASPTASAAAVVPSPTPTAAPTEPPPTSEPVDCPGSRATEHSSPDSVADPSCYGTVELTIDGWLAETTVWNFPWEATPSWTMASSELFALRPTAGQWMLDFLFMDRLGHGIPMITPPTSGVDLSGIGRRVRVRGHFNDLEALACTPVLPDVDPSELACDRMFVVTALEPLPEPKPDCPTGTITIPTFMATDAACFIGHDVKIAGWEDEWAGGGGVAPLYPVTLGPSFKLAEAQFTFGRWESDHPEPYLFPWTIAGSGVTFDRSDLRVVVTGHLGDAAASTCQPGPYAEWTWSPPVSWAQHRCERLFVITDVALGR
jgi:hypothetical protein